MSADDYLSGDLRVEARRERGEKNDPTGDELHALLRVLQEPRRPGLRDWAPAIGASLLLVGSCLRTMRGLFDLAGLFLGLAILGLASVAMLRERRQARRRAAMSRIVERWLGKGITP